MSPRDGSGTYSQPFPAVTEGTTIESTVYNGYTADVTLDLNSPRPVLSGGTGATSADGALDNLSAEKFKQVVTNWDATSWRAGSFYAATTAIGSAPVTSHAFAGVAYYANATDFVCEATDTTDPANPDKYIRVMAAGVWGAWVRLNPNTSSANLAEYTFNNQVTFPPSSGQIRFNNATQNLTTEVFISHLTATGVDNSSQIVAYLTSGVDFIIQDKDEGNKYKVFTTTAAAVLSGGDYRVTATLKIAGVDLVSAQRMVVTASSETQRVQQRQLIYAAPFDALGWSGMQVNGSMEVSQENGVTGISLSNLQKYIVDGFQVAAFATTGTLLAQQTVNGLFMRATTGFSAFTGADGVLVTQKIEGYRWSRLQFGGATASPVTIAFSTWATIPGTAFVTIRNSALNRSYVASFTINAASTWEYKTITIPGDIAGTWLTDNGIGAYLIFSFGNGPSAQTTPGSWVAGNFTAGPGGTNFFATTNNTVYLNSVVVLPGIEAPSAARSLLIMRPFDQELLTCQRYYGKSYLYTDAVGAVGVGSNQIQYAAAGVAGEYGPTISYPVEMRSTPTIGVYSPVTGLVARRRNLSTGVDEVVAGFNVVGTKSHSGSGAAHTAGQIYSYHFTRDARL